MIFYASLDGLQVFVWASCVLLNNVEKLVDFAKALDASFTHVKKSAYLVIPISKGTS